MRITRLTLHNFRNYADMSLPFTERRTLLVGPNGSGKSTILDALAWALTGRCRGVNARGEGQRDLIRAGADDMSVAVTLTLDGRETTLTRTYDAQGRTTATMPTEAILAKLNISAPLFAAIMHGRAFFDLDHKAAKDALLALLNVEIPGDKLPEPQPLPVSLYELDYLYDRAFETRTVVKRQLAALGAKSAFTHRADLERADLANLREQFTTFTTETSSAASRHGQKLALVESLADRIRKAEASASVEVIRGRRSVHEEHLLKAQSDLTAAEGKLAILKNAPHPASSGLAQQAQSLEVLIERLRRHAPSSGCVLSADIPCHTPAKEFAGHIAGLTKDTKELAETIKAASAYETDLRTAERLVVKHQQDVTYSQNQLTLATAALDDAERDKAALAALKAEHAQAKKDLPALKAAWTDAQANLTTSAALIESASAYNVARLAFEKEREQRADLTAQIEAAEKAVILLGPNGLRALYLGEALAGFTRQINEALLPFGFTLALQVEPWAVLIGTEGGAETRPYAMLSAGEQLWTAFAFQLALATVAGLNFVALDAAETVVGEARAVLTDLMFDTPVDQVVVAMAKGHDDPLPTLDGLQVVKVASRSSAIPV